MQTNVRVQCAVFILVTEYQIVVFVRQSSQCYLHYHLRADGVERRCCEPRVFHALVVDGGGRNLDGVSCPVVSDGEDGETVVVDGDADGEVAPYPSRQFPHIFTARPTRYRHVAGTPARRVAYECQYENDKVVGRTHFVRGVSALLR